MRNVALNVADSSFVGNLAGYGGAVVVGAQGINTPGTFTRTLFSGNTSVNGGVFYGVESSGTTSVTAIDSVFRDNVASGDGAVFHPGQATTPFHATFFNTTFYGNKAQGANGAVLTGNSQATLAVTNTILFGDTGANEISTAHPFASKNVQFSDIAQTGYAGSNGNLNVDPQLMDAAAGDLTPVGNSKCAGAGTGTGAPAADFVGRSWGTAVSIGAYAPVVTHFLFTTPATATPGVPFSFSVNALDRTNAPVATYDGTVHFTSSDSSATLPSDAALTNGAGTFEATLSGAGTTTLTATDTLDASLAGTSDGIAVLGDASVPADVDAATTASTPDAAADAGASVPGPTADDGGCGCRAAGRRSAPGAAGAPLVIGALAWLARRRRSSRRLGGGAARSRG